MDGVAAAALLPHPDVHRLTRRPFDLPSLFIADLRVTRPSLTIAIPTYNRAQNLRLLLSTLERELAGLGDRVRVLVNDNCSTDDTPEITDDFARRVPGTRVVRHASNLGPDENFCRCVAEADADYFWLIGDDDLPRPGAVRYVLDLIEQQAPDLVYLESAWHPALVDNGPDSPMPAVVPLALDQLRFARRVNVWTTFISGLVVRTDTFAGGAAPDELRRHMQTNLVQLSWVLGTLRRGRSFVYVPTPCVLATSGNTGGYGLLKVFGNNFAAIVGQHFGADSAVTRAVVRRCAIGYLPALMWSLRFASVGDFAYEDPSAALREQLGGYAAYRLLVVIGRAPRAVARVALLACQVGSRLLKLLDRVREPFGGRTALTAPRAR